jgi:hypothetical protein
MNSCCVSKKEKCNFFERTITFGGKRKLKGCSRDNNRRKKNAQGTIAG